MLDMIHRVGIPDCYHWGDPLLIQQMGDGRCSGECTKESAGGGLGMAPPFAAEQKLVSWLTDRKKGNHFDIVTGELHSEGAGYHNFLYFI